MQVNKCKSFGVNVVQYGQHILEAKDHATSAPQFEVKHRDCCRREKYGNRHKLNQDYWRIRTRHPINSRLLIDWSETVTMMTVIYGDATRPNVRTSHALR